MPIVTCSGDLFHAPLGFAIGHGCNCAGAMGKGIAIEFRKRFPSLYTHYKSACQDGQFRPGDVLVWAEGDRVVFNLGTQATWRTNAELRFVEAAVRVMLVKAENMNIKDIVLPQIAAGLGGLEWATVKQEIETIANESEVNLFVVEEFIFSQALRCTDSGQLISKSY